MHANVLALALSVAAAEPYELPPGSTVTELLDGPGGTAVAFYVEPLPGPISCGVGLAEVYDDLRYAAAFDAEGGLLWRARVRGLRQLWESRVRNDVTVEVSALYVEPPRAPRMMRFRVGGFGLERLP
jgi:hypothetical protein